MLALAVTSSRDSPFLVDDALRPFMCAGLTRSSEDVQYLTMRANRLARELIHQRWRTGTEHYDEICQHSRDGRSDASRQDQQHRPKERRSLRQNRSVQSPWL